MTGRTWAAQVDVLALGMLSAIRRALDFVNELRGSSITMDSLLREEDPAGLTR